jgi:hypothetical protein
MKKFTFLFIAAFLLGGCSQENKSRQLAIYTIPDNLNIYFGLPSDYELNQDPTLVKIHEGLDKHELFKTKNKKGVSPIKIDELDSGKYSIGVMPIEFLDADMNWQCVDPFLKTIGYVSSIEKLFDNFSVTRQKLKSGELKQEGGIVYLIEKQENEFLTIIILAKENISLEEYDKYYPEEYNFIFDTEKFIQDLEDKNVLLFLSDEELKKTIDILKRGGKICLNKVNIRFLIEIKDPSNWDIGIYREAIK